MAVKVAVLVGSLRKASYSRKLAHALVGVAPENLSLEIVEIGDLPLYDEDGEGHQPAWTAFRARMAPKEAVLFVTPEYNRSIPACLKNALDVGSRPYGQSVWSGKPGGVVSNSPGQLGGFGANHHLRQCLVFLDVPVVQQPEAYVSKVAESMDEDGRIIKDETNAFLAKFMAAYGAWVERIRAG
jgi:chromate reductase